MNTNTVYIDALLRNIGKVYQLPYNKSNNYKILTEQLSNIYYNTLYNNMSYDDTYYMLQNLLHGLKKKPTSNNYNNRTDERITTINNML